MLIRIATVPLRLPDRHALGSRCFLSPRYLLPFGDLAILANILAAITNSTLAISYVTAVVANISAILTNILRLSRICR